jgi:nucleoid-associated protein YgaU
VKGIAQLGGQLTAAREENTRLGTSGAALGALRTEIAEVKARLAESQKASEQHGATVAELTGANEKQASELKYLQGRLAALQADNARLARGDAARQEADQRAAGLAATAGQLSSAQRDLAAARAEISRLSETVQALDRDRTNRVAQLQQENAAIAARLRQAQGTLDQIASAARLINGGGAAAAAPAAVPVPVPAAAGPVTPAPRFHVVAEGDSLTRISVRYYGTTNRWQEIYDANRDTLRGENALRPGQRLRIP